MLNFACSKHCYIPNMANKKGEYPAYIRAYSTYAYDHTKYAGIYKKLGEVAKRLNNPDIYYRVSPYRVMEHCWYRDKYGKRKHLKDQRHIFRISALYRIHEELATYVKDNQEIEGLKLDFIKYTEEEYTHKQVRGGWQTYKGKCFEYRTVELKGTELKPIKERLKAHIALLRKLRKGEVIQKAVTEIQIKFDLGINSEEMKIKKELLKKILINYKKLREFANI